MLSGLGEAACISQISTFPGHFTPLHAGTIRNRIRTLVRLGYAECTRAHGGAQKFYLITQAGRDKIVGTKND